MFQVSKLLTDAFYIAGIKSRNANQVITTNEQTVAFDILNQIIDTYSLTAWFNSFLSTLTIDNSNQDIHIGKNLTPTSGVTIVDADPFKLFFSAGIVNSASNGVLYQLFIFPLSEQNSSFIVDSSGTPIYLFWANQLDNDGNIFTNIKLYPAPSSPSSLSLAGFRIKSQYQTVNDNILPTFYNYIKYLVAKELASQYGTLDLFMNRGGETQLSTFQNLLKNAAPISAEMNDYSAILRRNYYNGNTQ